MSSLTTEATKPPQVTGTGLVFALFSLYPGFLSHACVWGCAGLRDTCALTDVARFTLLISTQTSRVRNFALSFSRFSWETGVFGLSSLQQLRGIRAGSDCSCCEVKAPRRAKRSSYAGCVLFWKSRADVACLTRVSFTASPTLRVSGGVQILKHLTNFYTSPFLRSRVKWDTLSQPCLGGLTIRGISTVQGIFPFSFGPTSYCILFSKRSAPGTGQESFLVCNYFLFLFSPRLILGGHMRCHGLLKEGRNACD